ncbi:hypothetical protein Plhal304r1_c074g0162131 [Plasmopara halstedii]
MYHLFLNVCTFCIGQHETYTHIHSITYSRIIEHVSVVPYRYIVHTSVIIFFLARILDPYDVNNSIQLLLW